LRSAALVPILQFMGGSAAEAPTSPDAQPAGRIRASDAERDEVAARLREEFAAGRLSHDTFLFRMDAAFQARHQSDLLPLLADLPPAAGAPVPGQSGPGALAPGGSAPALPGPAPLASGAFAPGGPGGSAAPGGTNAPGGWQSGLRGRLRAALPRRPATTAWRADPGAPGAPGASADPTPSPRRGLARRLTSGMPRARSQERPSARAAPLQFPRGAGTLFSIGRDAGCDLAIADMTVSRIHARLERTQDGWLLTDLSSTNGTRVNGWRVRGQVRVRAGDLVSFGRAEYWLSAADGI